MRIRFRRFRLHTAVKHRAARCIPGDASFSHSMPARPPQRVPPPDLGLIPRSSRYGEWSAKKERRAMSRRTSP